MHCTGPFISAVKLFCVSLTYLKSVREKERYYITDSLIVFEDQDLSTLCTTKEQEMVCSFVCLFLLYGG